MRVLVVDDELLIRWSLHEALAANGWSVTEAGDAQTALKALTDGAELPDVVLLDYRLPDSDDLRLLASVLKLAPEGQVILMTAYGTPEVAEGALQLGAYRVVAKPFEVDEMAALVRQAHGERRA
jgi:DNA-binding NtrC family response regulator